jgi:hypothetical protein
VLDYKPIYYKDGVWTVYQTPPQYKDHDLVVLYGGPPSMNMTGKQIDIAHGTSQLKISYFSPDEYKYSSLPDSTYPLTTYTNQKIGYFQPYQYSGMPLKEKGQLVYVWHLMSHEDIIQEWYIRNGLHSNPFFELDPLPDSYGEINIPFKHNKFKPKHTPGEDCLF